jgi:hypothetical protein
VKIFPAANEVSMERLVFKEIEDGGKVAFYLQPSYLAISEVGFGDIEVAFGPDDSRTFISLLERVTGSKEDGITNSATGFLVHRFLNRDGDEPAAFLVRQCAGGIEISVATGIDEGDGVSALEHAGMAVSISREDGNTLAGALRKQLESTI